MHVIIPINGSLLPGGEAKQYFVMVEQRVRFSVGTFYIYHLVLTMSSMSLFCTHLITVSVVNFAAIVLYSPDNCMWLC